MSYTRTTTRRARKSHGCDSCEWRIQPGEHYLEHVAAPNHEDLSNERWWRMTECGNCAARYGRPIATTSPAADGQTSED